MPPEAPEPGEGPDPADLPEPPAEPQPPRPELRLRDLASDPGCSVCGRRRDPYIRLEVRGRIEYTCKECATGTVVRSCVTCGETLDDGDAFCGRCGAAVALKCPQCGTAHERGDRFCGRCGRAL